MGPIGNRPYVLVRAWIVAEKLAEFRRWHREVHVPHVLETPGIVEAVCLRPGTHGPNSVTAFAFAGDAVIREALRSPQIARARADWQEWAPFVRNLSIQIYTTLGTQATMRHWN